MPPVSILNYSLITKKRLERLLLQENMLYYVHDVLGSMVREHHSDKTLLMSKEFNHQLKTMIEESLTGELSDWGRMGADAGKRWKAEMMRRLKT